MKKTLAIIFIFAFLAVCITPGIAYICGYEPENYENRPLSRQAKLFARGGLNGAFPSDFDSWWEDHFGLREQAVTAFNALTMAVFADTLNEKVIVGKNGWLFYAETLSDYTGTTPMSDEDIKRAARVIGLIAEYCESLGVRFIYMNAPNKNTVYPEYMPSRILPAGGDGNMRRLYGALEESGVRTLDLAALLGEHKSEGDLYYEQDTHWNARGAMIAYRAIMELAAAGFEWEDYSANAAKESLAYRGDLHNFALPSVPGRMKYIDYGIDKEYTVVEGDPARDARFATSGAADGASIMLCRDSFGEALIPLISNNTSRAVYSQTFPYDLVFTAGEFDAVVIELVERNIKNLLVSAPLMPAVETKLPDGAEVCPGAAVLTRERSGYTQLYGCFDGAYRGGVYVELTFANGVKRAYEAFPILEEDALAASSGMASPQGFSLTVPEGVAGWTQVALYTVEK